MKAYLTISIIISIFTLTPWVSVYVALPILFFTWYLGIAFEHATRLEKTAPALMAGFIMWAKLYLTGEAGHDEANHAIAHISQILIFIMTAMTIVELVITHNGFYKIKAYIAKTGSINKLYWIVMAIVGILTMIIDNLTATILLGGFAVSMISIKENKLWFVAAIVLVANILGFTSPMGDLTTTMAWLAKLITTKDTILFLILPAIISSFTAAYLISKKIEHEDLTIDETEEKGDAVILYVALASFLLVPILKGVMHMEPWQIIPFSLAIVWIVSELRHPEQNFFDVGVEGKNIMHAFSKIELTAVFFFFGILFAVDSMSQIGQIKALTQGSLRLTQKGLDYIGVSVDYAFDIVNFFIGWLSSIVDNVPMMQAAIDGFTYAAETYEWYALAYSTGSGGNLLVIGSAAGVIAMTIVKGLTFGWWWKNVTKIALISYTIGYIALLVMKRFYF